LLLASSIALSVLFFLFSSKLPLSLTNSNHLLSTSLSSPLSVNYSFEDLVHASVHCSLLLTWMPFFASTLFQNFLFSSFWFLLRCSTLAFAHAPSASSPSLWQSTPLYMVSFVIVHTVLSHSRDCPFSLARCFAHSVLFSRFCLSLLSLLLYHLLLSFLLLCCSLLLFVK
jgi:hypothetical protein